MGRRKIEIKSIKDDRNRSVTFLKRKGGLFKKAHELSVLCSVDVAVIIFGNNKKLYEFSSGDITETLRKYHFSGGAHEHKGPGDFAGKGGADEDDEDDDAGASPSAEHPTPPDPRIIQNQFHNQPNLQHIRQTTASASPPMHNGIFQPRMGTPQPNPGSRPASRTHVRGQSSTLVALPSHPQSSQQQPPTNNYAYQAEPQYYSSQQAPTANMQASQHPPPHAPQHHYTHPVPHQNHLQQVYLQDQRRQSMPPNFPHHHQQQQQHHQHQQQQQQQQRQHQQQHQPQHQHHQDGSQHVVPVQHLPQHQRAFQSPPLPEPKPADAARSHSIYTPLDDSSSVLARNWGSSSYSSARTSETSVKTEQGPRSQSIDVGIVARKDDGEPSPKPLQGTHSSAMPPRGPIRTASGSTLGDFPIPQRTDSIQSNAKRPILSVQIPKTEEETNETAAEDPSSKASGEGEATPIKAKGTGVVLPPPSPSAGAILSAGASGPKNPFARGKPPLPMNNSTSHGRDMETPLSALPSRFMSDGLLPSPSSFYTDWGFNLTSRGNDSAHILPSPIQYQQTPAVANGPSFRDEDIDRKRKTSDTESDAAIGKRFKT